MVLWADIRLGPGKVLRVYGTHLGLDGATRLSQVDALLDLAMEHHGPKVWMGDFNATPDMPEIQRLVAGMAGTALSYGEPPLPLWLDPAPDSAAPTFPSHQPKSRIDYAFVSPDLTGSVLRYEALQSDASDHLPVLLELSL